MVRILYRGRLLAALAIAIGSIIAGWTPATAATLTVGKAAPNADPIIPVNVGDKLGIFKKHGLDLTIVDFTGGSKMTQAMVDFILTHKAETVKIESEITGFSERVMSRDYDLTIGMFTKDCKFDAESLATLKRSFVDLKLLATPPDMSALYTEAFLPK